ncbi:MAG: polysaccharide biosynthesis tyrosine autokinase [Candidatus Methylomirabilis sp.]|nr:polysaccharide biosynthesis tyrosine autokinase [Deltaproteobacteria bacterium]
MYDEKEVEPLHFGDYVKTLKKQKWKILFFFVLIVSLVQGYGFYVTPLYKAKATILFGRENPSAAAFQQEMILTAGTQGLLDRKEYQANQQELLQSKVFAKIVMEKLGLTHEYEPEDNAFNRFKKTFFGLTEDPVERFLEYLKVDRSNTLVSLFEITFEHADPQTAADVVNTLLDVYLDHTQEARIDQFRQAAAALGPEVEAVRAELQEKRRQLEQYKKENNAFSLDKGNNIAAQKLVELNAAVTAAKVMRLDAEANYKKALELQQRGVDGLGGLPMTALTPELAQLKTAYIATDGELVQAAERYKEGHPRMQQLRAQQEELREKVKVAVGRSVDGLINNYEIALAKERSLLGELTGQQQTIMELNTKEAGYNILSEEVSGLQRLFEQLQSRQHEANIAARLIPSAVQVIDNAAPPQQPSSPRKWLYFLIAVGAGLVLSVLFAFLFEYFDRTVKSMRDIEKELRAHVLGIVPKVKWLSGLRRVRPYTVSKDFPHLPVVEYFRHINSAIEGLTADRPARSLLITSTSPREGKSLVSANLGITLAQEGKRVLMVEADLRKPMLCRSFGIPEPMEGLTTVVRGESALDDVIQQTDQAGLYVMPAGPEPPSPSEIFNSSEMAALIKKLEQSYDMVLVDCPPLLEVSDSVTLSKMVGGVVWIISSGQTEKERATWAKRALDTIGARILGVVLNNVKYPRGSTGYYSRT